MKKQVMLRILTVLVMLVMLGTACLPTAAAVAGDLSVTVPSEDGGDPKATLSYRDGAFELRLNAEALYEMLSDRTVTREELAQFLPDDVLSLFTGDTKPTLEEVRAVLSAYVTKDDLRAMVADLPKPLVRELFDIEMITDLVDVSELLSLIDTDALLEDVNNETMLALLGGEPLRLAMTPTVLEKVMTPAFVLSLVQDPAFLTLIEDESVRADLHDLLADREKVDYDALLANEAFMEHVLGNPLVLPDLINALIEEGHITDLFTDALLTELLADGKIRIDDTTIEALTASGAVGTDTDAVRAILENATLWSDDLLPSLEGTPTAESFVSEVLSFTGENEIVDLDRFFAENPAALDVAAVDVATELWPILSDAQKADLQSRYPTLSLTDAEKRTELLALLADGTVTFAQLNAWSGFYAPAVSVELLLGSTYTDMDRLAAYVTNELTVSSAAWIRGLYLDGVIDTEDLQDWGLLNLERIFAHFDSMEAVTASGLMTEADIQAAVTDYIGFEGLHDFLLGNAALGLEGHEGAFSATVDVLIDHLADIWNDFIHDVDLETVIPDIRDAAEAVGYDVLVAHFGIRRLVKAAGGYVALLSHYTPTEIAKIAEAIGLNRVKQFIKDANIEEKLDLAALWNDVLALVKGKEAQLKALADELVNRFSNMLLQGVRSITLNGKPIFVTDEIYGDTATVGQFDIHRIIERLISAMPDVNTFLSLGPDADLFTLGVGLELDPARYGFDESKGENQYFFGLTLGFIGSPEKLQSLVAEYKDRFVIDPVYSAGDLILNVSSELPATVAVTYETLLQSDDEEIHDFLVNLPNATLSELIDFLETRTDDDLEKLASELSGKADTLKNKLTEALDKAGAVGDKLEAGYEKKLAEKVDRILYKLTTVEGLTELRTRAITFIKEQMGEDLYSTVDSLYDPATSSFKLSRPVEVNLYERISQFVTLPEKVMALFTDNMKITATVNLDVDVPNLHRIEVITAKESAAAISTFSLRRFRSAPVVDAGTETVVLYSPAGADPSIFRMGTLYDLDHNVLTAMPAQDATIMDDGIRTMAFDFNYDAATDGTVTEPLTYVIGYESTAIHALPAFSEGVTLRNGYHYAWTVDGVEIETLDDLHAAMNANPSRLTVKLVETPPVITFYESYEKYTADGHVTNDVPLGMIEFRPGESTFEELKADILAFLDANRTTTHDRKTTDAELKAMVEKIIADAALSEGGFDGDVTVTYDLKVYTVTLTYGSNTWTLHYKHGTSKLVEGDMPPITPPRGYTVAWPTVEFSQNQDLSYTAVETPILYYVRFETTLPNGTTSHATYPITVETVPAVGQTAWEAFLAATGAPASPVDVADFADAWITAGFRLPSDPTLTLPADPTTPIYVVSSSYTRTHGYLNFFNYTKQDEQVAAPYRYELAAGETFDATGAKYGIAVPNGYHIKAMLDADGNPITPDMTTAPADGSYEIYVELELNSYYVTFYDWDGNELKKLHFEHGTTTLLGGNIPDVPTYVGYDADWAYQNVAVEGKWEALLTGKTADLEIYPLRGDAKIYQVTFVDAQGTRTKDFTIESYQTLTPLDVRSKDADHDGGAWIGFSTDKLVVMENGEIVAIVADATFTAAYNRIAGYVLFVDEDGNKLVFDQNPIRFVFADGKKFSELDKKFLDRTHYITQFGSEPDLTTAPAADGIYRVTVTYEPETYYVKFVVNNGVIHTHEYRYDPAVTQVALPNVAKNYKIPGHDVTWPADPVTLTYTKDQTVTATVTPHTYHYKFVDEDTGVIYGEGTFQFSDTSLPEPALPTILGYDVLGWEDYRNMLPGVSQAAWENGHVLTVRLNKTIITYTATFLDGDVIITTVDFTIKDIEAGTLKAPDVPTREGYVGAWEDFTWTPESFEVELIWTPVGGEEPGPDDTDDTTEPDDTGDTDDTTKPVDGTETETDKPTPDKPNYDSGTWWILWLVIGMLAAVALILLLLFLLLMRLKNETKDEEPEPPAPVVVAVPEPEPEPEPVVEPEPEPVVMPEPEPAVVKVTYLSATSRAVINLCDLDARFNDGDTVTLELLKEMKLVSKKEKRLKVLGAGTITKALTVEADYFSGSAAEKIRAAGGTPIYKE